MAQNMKLSIVGQGIENVIVEINPHETFEDFQEKVLKENNLCITVEDFQLFFENLLPADNLFNCLRENLNIGDDVLSLENAPIYEINIYRENITENIKDEHNSSFIINDVIESATAEHFENLDTSLMVLNEGQSSEYTILNENLFEPSDFENKKSSEEHITLYSDNQQKSVDYMDIESKMAEMHDYNEEIITDICRLCVRNITDNKTEIYKDKLDEKINAVLPVNIGKDDGLPQQICGTCCEKISTYYEFVQIVLEGDKQLRIKFPTTLSETNRTTSVPDLVNELFSPKIVEKNIKFEPVESTETETEFEAEYLYAEEPNNKSTNNDKLNCRLCDLIIDSLEEAIQHSINEHHTNGLYICVFCDLGFQGANFLERHVKIEHRRLFLNKFQCTVCSKKYSSQLLLLKHTCVKSGASHSLHCEVCSNAFPTKVRLNFHRQFHVKDARPLFCSECNMSFKNENELYDHVIFIHDSKQSFQCEACDKTFSVRTALNNHKKTHLNKNHQYQCDICDKSFVDKKSLEDHEVIHMSSKPFQCHVCGKNLNRLSRLRRHLLTHESNPVINDVHICEICKEAFAEEGNAEFHKTCMHNNKLCIKVISTDKVFRCEFCERCYYTPMGLNDHRSTHTGPTPYNCHICKSQFSSYARCTTHKATHGLYKDGGEKDNFPVVKHFLCEHCGKSYLHWSYLGLHRRLKHSETVQIYKCPDCKLQFPNSWGLAYHRKTKHSIDNFKCIDCGKVLANEHCLKLHHLTKHAPQKKDNQCVICGKIFQYPTSLEAHMKAHKGLREFKCALCPKVYLNLGTLTAHFAEHKARKFVFPNEETLTDTDRPFTCDVCGLSFRRQFTLKNHKLKHTQPTAEGSFVLMVDMKEDQDQQENKEKLVAENVAEVAENVAAAAPQEMLTESFQPNYIDLGNGNIMQIPGNTFTMGGKQYVLVDEQGKALGRNQEFEMIVDETLRGEEPQLQPQQPALEQNMYVEPENNYMLHSQPEVQPEYIFTTTDKIAKTVTTSATYVIDGNQFLVQPDEQTF